MKVLLAHTLRANAARLLIVALGLAVWGFLMPIIYKTFGADFKKMVDAGLIPKAFVDFLGGNVLTLAGSISLGVIHPIAVFLKALFAVGFGLYAVAGERQRGTLEVLLARPINRRAVHAVLLVAIAMFSAVAVAAEIVGAIAGSAAVGLTDELVPGQLAFLWLNGLLLYVALGSLALAASVSFDRVAPAATAALSIIVLSYVLEILAELWPNARDLGAWSIFHYLDPRSILSGSSQSGDLVVLSIVALAAAAYAQVVFARRDLAAPS